MSAGQVGPGRTRRRVLRGFTLMEMGIAMALMAAAMILVVQLGYWSVRHRSRMASRYLALELAANVLEEAQAVPWDALTHEWAESQSIAHDLVGELPEGKLTAYVEPLEDQKSVKRVRVQLSWTPHEGAGTHTVRLFGLSSRRAVPAEEIKR